MTTQQNMTVTVGEQPIDVHVSDEEMNFAVGEQPIDVLVANEVLNFSLPLVLSGGWPFGENPRRVGGIVANTPTVVDRVAMPGKYRVVKWLFLLFDEANGLGVSSEINAFTRGGIVEFSEYAVLGDADAIEYTVDLVPDGEFFQLVITSQYDGVLDAKTVKIGIFS